MNKQLFTANDAWTGGFYELALEIGRRSDERLQTALEAIWSHSDLDGCFLERNLEPSNQIRVRPNILEDGSHLLGTARVPNGSHVTCGSCIIREDDDGSDWLDVYLPTGSLSRAYPVGGYPFDDETEEIDRGRYEIEDWLAGIGQMVAQAVAYRLGIIGFEVSGQVHAADIVETGVPAKRHIGYLWPESGKMKYFRRNAY